MQAIGLHRDFHLGRGRNAPVLSAVRDVTFSLYRKAVVSIVGESGSGKSTVARLLAGQDHPTSGEIRLDGWTVDLSGRHAFREYKSEVQMVFQDPFASLNPVHTVRYHLARTVQLHRRPSGRDELQRELVGLLEQVRLLPAQQFLAKYPHELSGGQRQRVAIARALGARPSVLLADEPVSMLDVSIRLEVLNLLDDLRDRFELAVLYITHDIASARYFADEILVMYAGEVVERGAAEEVTQLPAHPYTQLLVASSPDPDALGSVLHGGVKGEARRAGSSLSTVVGCRFAPRCPFAEDHCRREAPPLVQISASRAAACWRLDVAAPALLTGATDGGKAATSHRREKGRHL